MFQHYIVLDRCMKNVIADALSEESLIPTRRKSHIIYLNLDTNMKRIIRNHTLNNKTITIHANLIIMQWMKQDDQRITTDLVWRLRHPDLMALEGKMYFEPMLNNIA